MAEKVAIIDLGTNTFHLLIAEVVDHRPKIVFRERQAVKMGRGGINRGLIMPDAIDRALVCLKSFKKKLDMERVTRVRAIGTSAFRSATNAGELLTRIKKETGIPVEVISGDQEAEFIYYGVRSALDLGSARSLIMDIGGGSVEFIICDNNQIYWKQSFDIGAQRLLEQFQKHDPILPAEISLLESHYDAALSPLSTAIRVHQPKILIGSSGTFDTLSEIHCIHEERKYSEIETESPLTVAAFFEIHKMLVTRDRAARLQIPGMIEMRVDMIVVASLLIRYILDQFPFERIRVSSYALKEGVLDRLANNPSEPRREARDQ